MFVGYFYYGNLYCFDLNKKRTELSLDKGGGPLKDKIASSTKELQDVIFGTGFGGITDIEVGPDDDSNLYILLLEEMVYYIFRMAHEINQ